MGANKKRLGMNIPPFILLVWSSFIGVLDLISRAATAKSIYDSLPLWMVYVGNPAVLMLLIAGILFWLSRVNHDTREETSILLGANSQPITSPIRGAHSGLRTVAVIAVVAVVTGAIFGWVAWLYMRPTVYAPFAEIYKTHEQALGKPIAEAKTSEHYYYAAHERAIAIWFIDSAHFYVLDQRNSDWARPADLVWDSNPKWVNEEYLRKRWPSDRFYGPPYSGVAKLWNREEGKWEWMGGRIFHCNYLKSDVFYQEFQHGLIMGGFLFTPGLDKREVFALINEGESNDKGKYDAKGSELAKVPTCTPP